MFLGDEVDGKYLQVDFDGFFHVRLDFVDLEDIYQSLQASQADLPVHHLLLTTIIITI